MITLHAINTSEWSQYRRLRLQALRDSHDAFGSTDEAEAYRPEEAWQARLAEASTSGHCERREAMLCTPKKEVQSRKIAPFWSSRSQLGHRRRRHLVPVELHRVLRTAR